MRKHTTRVFSILALHLQVQLVRLTSGARGTKSMAPIAGLALLPVSRLMVFGCEDGTVKVCA